ncbi:hypothetical protein SESBI_49120 [Sesbania bispinosa]|nr:hypothetical protein SESBI_49120 [Sesbania bispinosa]
MPSNRMPPHPHHPSSVTRIRSTSVRLPRIRCLCPSSVTRIGCLLNHHHLEALSDVPFDPAIESSSHFIASCRFSLMAQQEAQNNMSRNPTIVVLFVVVLLISAWTGFFANCLHTLSGLEHLAALTVMSKSQQVPHRLFFFLLSSLLCFELVLVDTKYQRTRGY